MRMKCENCRARACARNTARETENDRQNDRVTNDDCACITRAELSRHRRRQPVSCTIVVVTTTGRRRYITVRACCVGGEPVAMQHTHKADKLPPRYLYKDAVQPTCGVRVCSRTQARRYNTYDSERSKHSGHWHPARGGLCAAPTLLQSLDRPTDRRTPLLLVRSLAFSIL